MAYLIRVGFFKPGEQIPSVRSLSTSARINYTTVTKAYKNLEQNDLIVSIRGRGMYVQKGIAPHQEGADTAIDIALEDCIKQYRAVGMTFEDIRARINHITEQLETETRSAAEEKMEYYDA
ncbi:MAG: GntR family transcriptional regulator [Coriobacteriales bacterium]|jgi:GntR family transcriptional regulator|nr:GntR family transcriptional regulator [Coriobacteriales bacterium]